MVNVFLDYLFERRLNRREQTSSGKPRVERESEAV